jgi:diaminopimelate decarboxylase
MVPERVARALAAAPAPVCAYVYDRDVLRARAARLRAALPAGTTILYAAKANSHPDVVRTLAAATDGIEVASGGELAAARAAGARRIAFAGPAKTDDELRAAVAAGATVHVESVHEMRRLTHVADRAVQAALRVNRATGTGLSGSHAMTGTPTPFGLTEEQLPAAVAAAGDGIRLVGFHLHAVSNNVDGAAHATFVREALDWSVAAAARLGIDLAYVNVGGGFGVDHAGTAECDVTALRAVAVPADVELTVEPGRWLAADAGWYAAEVLDLKLTHGRWFAVLRGGTHHFRLPAAWGYSHPFDVLPTQRWPYGFARPEVRDVAVDAVGELCTPRDVLTRGQPVDRLRVGDVLVFGRTGAYGWDISHHEFLRHPHPDVVML